MTISRKDRTILQELAAEVANIAALPIQQEKADMWRHGSIVWSNTKNWVFWH